MRFSTRVTLLFTFTAVISVGAASLASSAASAIGLPRVVALSLAALCALPVVIWASATIIRQIASLHDDLGNALRAARDGDHSIRLTARGDKEIAELKSLYNELADAVRGDRNEIQGREILLDTILQRTPQAVVLLDQSERVIFANVTARQLLAGGARLNGRRLGDIVESVNEELRELLLQRKDALIRLDEETFHLTQRTFQLHTHQHRLIMIERLTPELRRQELNVWKRAIRIINHEINNSIAPVSSLFHSARVIREKPEHQHRLEEIYGLIEERLTHLRHFLDSYAEFARLPEPRKALVRWRDLLDPVRAFYDFQVEGESGIESSLDAAQMQQVLINLVKNAHESGSAAENVVVSLGRTGEDVVLRVVDRGRGMTEEVMRQALVPFYTTKHSGTGLGLALCNEIVEAHGGRLRLASREGGGTIVTCWLPVS